MRDVSAQSPLDGRSHACHSLTGLAGRQGEVTAATTLARMPVRKKHSPTRRARYIGFHWRRSRRGPRQAANRPLPRSSKAADGRHHEKSVCDCSAPERCSGQVVQICRVMKQAGAYLMPYREEEKGRTGARGELRPENRGSATSRATRPRQRQEHRWWCLQLQQLRSDRLASWCGPRRQRDREREKANLIGLSGLITPRRLTRVPSRGRDGAPGLRDDAMIGGATTQPGSHGRENPANYRRGPSRPSMSTNFCQAPRGRPYRRLCWPANKWRVTSPISAPNNPDRPRARLTRGGRAEKAHEAHRGARPMPSSSLGRKLPPDATACRHRALRDVPLPTRAVIGWSPCLLDWELTGKYPAIPQRRQNMGLRAGAIDVPKAIARKINPRKTVCGPRRRRLLASQCGGDDLTVYAGRGARPAIATLATRCAQQLARREGRANVRWPISSHNRSSGIAELPGCVRVTASRRR